MCTRPSCLSRARACATGMASRSGDIAAVLSDALRRSGDGARPSGNASAHDDHVTGPGLERAGSSQEL